MFASTNEKKINCQTKELYLIEMVDSAIGDSKNNNLKGWKL
jgi:hypothetical protein